MTELDDARVALERTIAGSTPGTVINGYRIGLVRPGGERHLVALAEDDDLHPQVIQSASAAGMLEALGQSWKFTDRHGNQ
jgi:hypothetical protein